MYMIKGPVSYLCAEYKDHSFYFFGDHHERNTNCDGEDFISYVKKKREKNPETHFFLEAIFVDSPTDMEYRQLYAYEKNNAKINKGNSPLFEVSPWFWKEKKKHPNFFHPLDIRRETPYHKGISYNSEVNLNDAINFYIYKENSNDYIQKAIQKARKTSYCKAEIDTFIMNEWKSIQKHYNRVKDLEWFKVSFEAVIMDAYALYKMFQPEYKQVICYTGHAHWSRYKRFLKYINVQYYIDFDVAGCVDTNSRAMLKF